MTKEINIVARHSLGSMTGIFIDFSADDDYPEGGYPFTTKELGVNTIEGILSIENSGYIYEFDRTNKKLKVLAGGDGTFTPTGDISVDDTETVANTQTLFDIKGSANTDSENSDAASLPTNGNYVAAAAAVSGGAWTHGALTSPDVPRNVGISITNDSGGALNLFEGVMTFTVTGTDKNGTAQTETITFTSSAGNKSVADTKFRYKYGVKAFKTVTDITLDNEPANGLKIGASLGSKIAILNTLKTPAEADVLRAAVNATNYSVSSKVDTTYNTLNFGTLADGDDVSLTALTTVGTAFTFAGDEIAASAAEEMADGSDLSSLTNVRLFVLAV